MKKIKMLIILSVSALIVIIIVIVFEPVIDVNVIFDRCLNENEVATVFQDTSFKSYQYYYVLDDAAGMGLTSNEQFGAPLEGAALETALAAGPQSTGVAVIDGSVTLFDIAKIKKSPFVYDIVVYFPTLNMGDRDILPNSSTRFFERNPAARYWE